MHIAHTPGIWAASIFIHNGAPQALVRCLAGEPCLAHFECDRKSPAYGFLTANG
jgi:hypothetical protein